MKCTQAHARSYISLQQCDAYLQPLCDRLLQRLCKGNVIRSPQHYLTTIVSFVYRSKLPAEHSNAMGGGKCDGTIWLGEQGLLQMSSCALLGASQADVVLGSMALWYSCVTCEPDYQ